MSASSRRSWHSSTNNERTIDQQKLQLLLRAKENDKLRNDINVLRNKLLNEQKMKSKYKREVDRLTGKILKNEYGSTDHEAGLELDLGHYICKTHQQLAPRTKAQVLCKVMYNREFMDGIVFKEVMIKSRDFYHDFIFPNYDVLKAMDVKGGCLNYTGIEILRNLERQDWVRAELFDKKRFKSILPSKSDLTRTSKRIETVVDGIIPTTQFHTASGEEIKFDNVAAVIGLLFKVYGLEEAAKVRPVVISSAADAAPVTKTLTALTQGIAVTDMGAISPWTGRPLCLSAMLGTEWDTDGNPITLATRDEIQSINEMYPLSVMFGNETKENMEHMGVTYDKLTVFQTDATAINLLFVPLEVNHKVDI
jgi:hypothetical protein